MSSSARSANRVLMGAGDFTFVQDWARCVAAFADVELLCPPSWSRPSSSDLSWREFSRRRWRPSRLMHALNLRHDHRELAGIAREAGSTALHTHFYSTTEAALAVSRQMGIPLVHTEHSGKLLTGQASRAGLEVFYDVTKHAALVLAVSTGLRDAMLRLGVKRHVEVIPNPLGNDWFVEPPTPRGSSGAHFVNVGWLQRHKGQRTLLASFAELKGRVPAATLTLVGDGPELRLLTDMAKELEVEHSVTFVGRLDSTGVREELMKADVYVHASQSETFGVAMVEAWACGLPVATLPCGGVSSLADQIGGICARSRSSSELARVMHELATPLSPAQRLAIQQACRASFSVDAVAGALSSLYPLASG